MKLPGLVPVPASVDVAEADPFVLRPGLAIDGDAAGDLAELLRVRTGIESDRGTGEGPAAIALRLAPEGARAESYRIAVDAASVIVTAADAAGLFYAVQTLGQLMIGHGDGWAIPPVTIADAPRFAYRGVMLDVARHFHPVETVTAYIDRAASLKFNALHLHLSDDQGWRLELHSRPELTARASATAVGGDPGGFYTHDDYRAIVAHAARRHMIVVPEFDMPGHTHAVGLAHPDLALPPVLSGEIVAASDGVLPVAGQPYTGIAVGFSSLDTHAEATYAFVADVFGEVAALTPGPYLHLGGDECLGTPRADYDAFLRRATRIVADLGKTPITWHEAGGADLAPGTVGQYWGFVTPVDGADAAARAFAPGTGGGGLILSPADAVYLDMKPDADSPLGLAWAIGPTSLADAYGWEPLDLVSGLGEHDVLGVEAPMWSETIRTLADIDAMAFPRIAAAAEIAWSPVAASAPARTWESFAERLGDLGPLWTRMGIGYDPRPEIRWS